MSWFSFYRWRRGKEKGIYGCECRNHTQSHQQRHHNWIGQGDAKKFRLASGADEPMKEIVLEQAEISAICETNRRCNAHDAEAESHHMGITRLSRQSTVKTDLRNDATAFRVADIIWRSKSSGAVAKGI